MTGKNSIKTILLGATALQLFGAAAASAASDEGFKRSSPWELRGRVIGVMPSGGGNTTIGGRPEPGNAVVPEFDISYFFTDHIAAELILATSPHHVSLKNSSLNNLDIGDTWILPPTLTLQYHFVPGAQFSPYVGAGVNYTLPYSEDNGANTNKLKVDGSFGWGLQAGTDYWLTKNWGLNVDVKKVYVDVDASINDGNITGNVKLDPWIIGAGVAYRF